MTNQTFDFSQPFNTGSGVNIFGSPIITSASDEFQRQTWRQLPSPDPKKYRIQELTVWDLRNGIQQRGGLIGTETSTLDQRYGLSLGSLVNSTDLATATNDKFITSCHFGPNQTFVMAVGGTSGFCLFSEAGLTNPTVSPISYNPGASTKIRNVRPIIQGSATAAEMLAICRDNNTAIEILSDLTPTSVGSMHSATQNCYGFLTSPINAAGNGALTHLIPANGTLYSLSSALAIGTAPTSLLTSIPIGVMPIAIEQLQKNLPLRSYWFWPPQSGSTLQAQVPQIVKSIDLDGASPFDINFSMGRVLGGLEWNRTITVHNGNQIASYDGESERNLNFQKNRPLDNNFRWGTNGIFKVGSDLYSLTVKADAAQGGLAGGSGLAGNSVLNVERYTPEFDAWVPTSGAITLQTGDNSLSTLPWGPGIQYGDWNASVPVSLTSSNVHIGFHSSDIWQHLLVWPPGIDPFLHDNGSGTGFWPIGGFATGGTMTSNEFSIPGAGRNPTVLYEIDATQMNTVAGGSAAQVAVTWATQSSTGQSWSFSDALSATFRGSDPQDKMYRTFYQNTSTFSLGKFQIAVTRGASDGQTPNALPVTFRMITYLEGKVDKPPLSVLSGVKP